MTGWRLSEMNKDQIRSRMAELLEQGDAAVGCIVPIERLAALMSAAPAGGPLAELATPPPAAWTQTATPAGLQVMGAVNCRGHRFDQGAALLRQALAAEPALAAGLLELGMCHQLQGEH